jgi:predicted MFS family arabinose efflux permease
LITEIAPNVRATLLSLGVAGFSLGRTLGSITGPVLYGGYGFAVTCMFSAAAILVASVIWFMFVREKHPEVRPA